MKEISEGGSFFVFILRAERGRSVIGIPISARKEMQMKIETEEYMTLERRQEIAEKARKLR